MDIKVRPEDIDDILKEIFWLAWQACGGTSGMGLLQDNPQANKEAVFQNVLTSGDYLGGYIHREDNSLSADYVFGRMMKLSIRFDRKNGVINIPEREPKPDYQAWSRKYHSYKELVNQAITNVLS